MLYLCSIIILIFIREKDGNCRCNGGIDVVQLLDGALRLTDAVLLGRPQGDYETVDVMAAQVW